MANEKVTTISSGYRGYSDFHINGSRVAHSVLTKKHVIPKGYRSLKKQDCQKPEGCNLSTLFPVLLANDQGKQRKPEQRRKEK